MNATNIDRAREVLAEFEARMTSSEALRHLSEGLDLLDEVILAAGSEAQVAVNIGHTYANKIETFVSEALERGEATEPEAEHLFRLILELEPYEFGDGDKRSSLKVAVFKLLMDHYFQGYSKEEKQRELERLLGRTKT